MAPWDPPRGRQMDRKAGEEEVSREKQWGWEELRKEENAGEKKPIIIFPSQLDTDFHLLLFT